MFTYVFVYLFICLQVLIQWHCYGGLSSEHWSEVCLPSVQQEINTGTQIVSQTNQVYFILSQNLICVCSGRIVVIIYHL